MKTETLKNLKQTMLNDAEKDVIFSITIENELIADSSAVIRELTTHFATRSIIFDEESETAYDYFKETFTFFKNVNSKNWAYLYKAIYADYNPIENYNMTEKLEKSSNIGKITKTNNNTNIDTETTTVSHSDDDTISTDINITTTTTNSVNNPPKSSDYVTTYEDTTPRLNSYTENSGETSVTNSGDGSNNKTTMHYSNIETTKENTRTIDTMETTEQNESNATKENYTLTRKGDMGVKSTQSMIFEEIALRKNNIFKIIINQFIDNYTIYC